MQLREILLVRFINETAIEDSRSLDPWIQRRSVSLDATTGLPSNCNASFVHVGELRCAGHFVDPVYGVGEICAFGKGEDTTCRGAAVCDDLERMRDCEFGAGGEHARRIHLKPPR